LGKKIAILVVAALFWLPGTESLPAAAASTKSSARSSFVPNRTSGSISRSSASIKSGKRIQSSKSRKRRRSSRWWPSSYGDPTAGDNPAGEDPNVREAAVEALGNWNGSAVVVDPNNGRVLSIVNQQLALASGFTPCSTFKPIVGLAALKEGIITPETKIRVGRRTRMDLTEALAHSNNPFFAKLGKQLGFNRLYEIAHRFGLGEKSGLNIPGESAGRFPETVPIEGGVGLMSSHGKAIGVTPLQMAAAMAAIANGGTLYHLQYPRTPEEIMDFQPQVRQRLDDLSEYFPQVKEGLAATVLYGTGRQAYDPEESILGKTGTCSENGARLGWFVSYTSEPQPKYVVVVLLRGGRLVYGPHAAEIAGRLYRGLRQREQFPAQALTPPLMPSGLLNLSF
jgi:cell division protein FtsI/penicillin-binding protein 2